MLLFGAGASVEGLVPDSNRMTERIVEEFRKDNHPKRHKDVINFVIGGLLFKKGIQGENPLNAGVNVEELFNAVQLLGERNTLEAAPFIGSWHSMIEELDKIEAPELRLGQLHRAIYESVTKSILDALPRNPPSFGGRDIDRSLQSAIKKTVEALVKNRSASFGSSESVGKEVGEYVVEITRKWIEGIRSSPSSSYEFEREFAKALDRRERPGEGRIFTEINNAMIRALIDIVWIEDATRFEYLLPILNTLKSQKKITVATLNYDNGIEKLAALKNIPCKTGIEDWDNTGKFDMGSEGLSLLKLHGSIDWLYASAVTDARPMPFFLLQVVPEKPKFMQDFMPAVIFGQKNKLTADGPFLDLLRTFQQELANIDTLTIVGYSFGDPHINVYLTQWLNRDPENQMRIVDPYFNTNPREYAVQLRSLASNQIKIFPVKASEGLAQLYPSLN